MDGNQHKAKLDQDLKQKLDQLYSLLKQQSLNISQRFDEVVSWIDYDAETILHHLEHQVPIDQQLVSKTNVARIEFIRVLKAVEEKLHQSVQSAAHSGEEFESLEKRVQEFLDSPSNLDGDINQLEDSYVELALEIIKQTNQQERRIFGNQSFVYRSSKDLKKLGSLIHFTDVCLSREEIDILRFHLFRRNYVMNHRLKLIHEAFEERLNRSLAVNVRRPLVLDRTLVTINFCLEKIGAEKMDDPILVQRSEHENLEPILVQCGFDDQLQPGYEVDTAKLNHKFIKTDTSYHEIYQFCNSSAEGIYADLQTLEKRQLRLNDNKLRSLDLDLLSFFSCFTEIDLTNNQLESLNEELLGRCTRLKTLKLSSACLPDTRFSLNFLESLAQNLQCLELTLPPESQLDLNLFGRLNNLQSLHLDGPASLDANREHPKLNKSKLSEIFGAQLEELKLSYFDLPVITKETFSGMNKLAELMMSHCRITRINSDAFSGQLDDMFDLEISCNQITELPDDLFSSMPNLTRLYLELNEIKRIGPKCFGGLSELEELSLRGNRIKDLPPGVFDDLNGLNQLDLSCNKISRIKNGVLGDLRKLSALKLDRNPITDLDGDWFKQLVNLESLSLSHCKLTAVHNMMFVELKKLKFLYLDHNLISSFRIVTWAFTMDIDSANLSLLEHRMAQVHLFRDQSKLQELSLEGNKFEKLDLNCFANLKKLDKLELASNNINELNTQIYGATLANVSRLDLSNNQLTYISNNAFISTYVLYILNLSGNKLQRLDDGFLGPFSELHRFFARNSWEIPFIYVVLNGQYQNRNHFIKHLDIEDARRDDFYPSIAASWAHVPKVRVEPGAIDKLELQNTQPQVVQVAIESIEKHQSFAKLRKLNLIKCSLQTLDQLELATRFPSLVKLDLSKNLLTTIKTCWLSGCPSLEFLDLSDNLIESLDDADLFSNSPLLASINLSSNRLRSVNRRLFHGLFKLKTLNLAKNGQLSVLDEGLLNSLVCVKEINLSGNDMERLNLPKLFKSCRNLEKLDLSFNQLDAQTINESSMGQLANLKELKLSHNQLGSLEFLKVVPRLKRLDLSHNKIEAIVKDSYNFLGRMVNLLHLDLSGNSIGSMTKDMFDHLEHVLVSLDISGNPCSTEFVKKLRLYDQQKAKERQSNEEERG